MQKRLGANLLSRLSILIIIFSPGTSFSQEHKSNYIITTRLLTAKDGLAGKQVNCGIQDSKGFIWFGTAHGLQRYDGKNFKLYTKEKNGLQGNNIVQLAEDEKQRLWILYGIPGTNKYNAGKADIMELSTGTVKSVATYFGKDLPFQEKEIDVVKSTGKNKLLVVTHPQDKKNEGWYYTGSAGFRKLPLQNLYGFYHEIIFTDSLLVIQLTDGSFARISSDSSYVISKNSSDPALDWYPLGITQDGSTFIVSVPVTIHNQHDPKYPAPAIYKLLSDGSIERSAIQLFKKQFVTYEEGNIQMFHSVQGRGILMQVNSLGLYLFHGSGFIELMDTVELKSHQFPRIYDYFQTGSDQHWICTEYGVTIITVKPNHFTHLMSSDEIKLGLPTGHQCRSIYADSSGIYTMSWDGFYRITETDSGHRYKKLLDALTVGMGDGFFFDGNYFWMSAAATHEVSLTRLKLPENKIDLIPSESNGMWAAITDKEGNLLKANVNSISILDGPRFRKINYCSKGEYDAWFYQFLYTRDNRLWAVSNHGLYEIKNNCIVANYSADAKYPAYKIPFTDIHYVYEDKSGNFWLATNGGGLIRWDRVNNTSHQFTVADGLSSNVLYSILPDENGFFWISSEYGLMRFDPVSHSVKTYTTDDGITDNEFNRISYFKAADGRMFFGGMNGVNAFYPKDFFSDTSAFDVPLRIVSFNQFSGEKDMLTDKTMELSQKNFITLNPGDKFFTLEFQLLDYEEGKHRYAYKIEGVDKDWNYIGENSIRLSNLPYGNFTLRIRGQNFEGAWSRNELTIPLNVLKPFYKTDWFYILSVLTLVLAIYLVFRWRTLRLQQANIMLEGRVNERTLQLQRSLGEKDVLLQEKDMLMKEIHHRVKNNLQVISGLLELQGKGLQDEKSKTALMEGRNRVRSIALIHQNLYQHENISEVEMNHFVMDLHKHISGILKQATQQVEFTAQIPSLFLDIDTAVPIGLIINELLTNSYKYAFDHRPGKINIELLEKENQQYELRYSDSGPGMPADFNLSKSKSLGMQLVHDLSRQISGSVNYVRSEPSFFIITFVNRESRKKQD